MSDFLKDPQVGSMLYMLGVVCGALLRHYIYDVIKNYVYEKMKPGIIKLYLEEEMKKQQPVDKPYIPSVVPQNLSIEDSIVAGLEVGLQEKKE